MKHLNTLPMSCRVKSLSVCKFSKISDKNLRRYQTFHVFGKVGWLGSLHLSMTMKVWIWSQIILSSAQLKNQSDSSYGSWDIQIWSHKPYQQAQRATNFGKVEKSIVRKSCLSVANRSGELWSFWHSCASCITVSAYIQRLTWDFNCMFSFSSAFRRCKNFLSPLLYFCVTYEYKRGDTLKKSAWEL